MTQMIAQSANGMSFLFSHAPSVGYNVLKGAGARMPGHEKLVPIVGSIAVMSAATAILWYANLAAAESHQLVYFYLLPVVLIAYLYGGRMAMWCTGLAVIGADYFLQYPIYSMYNSNPLEYGDLVVFAVLAALAIKCTRILMRPSNGNMRRPVRLPGKTET